MESLLLSLKSIIALIESMKGTRKLIPVSAFYERYLNAQQFNTGLSYDRMLEKAKTITNKKLLQKQE